MIFSCWISKIETFRIEGQSTSAEGEIMFGDNIYSDDGRSRPFHKLGLPNCGQLATIDFDDCRNSNQLR